MAPEVPVDTQDDLALGGDVYPWNMEEDMPRAALDTTEFVLVALAGALRALSVLRPGRLASAPPAARARRPAGGEDRLVFAQGTFARRCAGFEQRRINQRKKWARKGCEAARKKESESRRRRILDMKPNVAMRHKRQ